MKSRKITFLLLLAISIISCTLSPEEKAKKTIKDYMFKTLNDFESYNPVEYGNIDSLFSDYTMDQVYIEGTKIYKRSLEIKDSLNKIFDRNKIYDISPTENELNLFLTINWFTNITYPNVIDSLKRNYQSHFIGMGLIHKFRAKTNSGGIRLCSWQFILSPNFEEVISTINLEKESPIANYSKVENGNEKKEKEERAMGLKYAKEKEIHDKFFENLSKETDIIKLKRGVIGKIIEKGKGAVINHNKETKIKTRFLDINGNELRSEEQDVKISYTLFMDIEDIRKGCKIITYTPYEANNDTNKKPYEIVIMEVTFL
ncbi:MAG: hypothetical protein ACLS4S_01385 [Bacteroides nordii]